MACAIIMHIFLNFQKSFIEKQTKVKKKKKKHENENIMYLVHPWIKFGRYLWRQPQ